MGAEGVQRWTKEFLDDLKKTLQKRDKECELKTGTTIRVTQNDINPGVRRDDPLMSNWYDFTWPFSCGWAAIGTGYFYLEADVTVARTSDGIVGNYTLYYHGRDVYHNHEGNPLMTPYKWLTDYAPYTITWEATSKGTRRIP